jgi:hypothetical protein
VTIWSKIRNANTHPCRVTYDFFLFLSLSGRMAQSEDWVIFFPRSFASLNLALFGQVRKLKRDVNVLVTCAFHFLSHFYLFVSIVYRYTQLLRSATLSLSVTPHTSVQFIYPTSLLFVVNLPKSHIRILIRDVMLLRIWLRDASLPLPWINIS